VHGEQLEGEQPDDVEGQLDLRRRRVPEDVGPEDLL
jgi:hypothetical protein